MNRKIKMLLRCSLKNAALLFMFVILFIIISLMTDTPVSKRFVNTNVPGSYNSSISPYSKETNITGITRASTSSHPPAEVSYPHPYKYIYKPSTICISSVPFLLIIVKSNVRNLDNRMAIRSTWGNISDPSVKVVFLLGYSSFLKTFINMEHNLYDDIVQEDFIDHYNNNTLKTVMGFNWAVSHCQMTKYFFFVDDDYLVNVRFLIEDLRKLKPNTSIFTGCVWYNAKPNRDKRRKWFVSKLDFPDNVWPPYATGGSMVVSFDYAIKMTEGFKYTKPLYIDDVYLGIVAKKLNIPLKNDGRFHPYYNFNRIHQFYSIHNFQSPRKLVEDWNKVKEKMKI